MFKLVFKCIQTLAPKADNALFVKEDDASLIFKAWFTDDDFPDTASGYVGTNDGDSGGPVWIDTEINGVVTPTIIAVFNGGIPGNLHRKREAHQCRDVATKVSEEVVNWINEESELN